MCINKLLSLWKEEIYFNIIFNSSSNAFILLNSN
jgi:hypothetical protein